MENFKQSDPFISNYHPNPRISALDPVYTNPDIRVNQIYRFKNVWIRMNEALVIRYAGTVYCTISASQWYIMTA